MTARDRLAALIREADERVAATLREQGTVNAVLEAMRDPATLLARELLASGEVLVVSALSDKAIRKLAPLPESANWCWNDADAFRRGLKDAATRQAGGAPEEARDG